MGCRHEVSKWLRLLAYVTGTVNQERSHYRHRHHTHHRQSRHPDRRYTLSHAVLPRPQSDRYPGLSAGRVHLQHLLQCRPRHHDRYRSESVYDHGDHRQFFPRHVHLFRQPSRYGTVTASIAPSLCSGGTSNPVTVTWVQPTPGLTTSPVTRWWATISQAE